MSRRGQRPHQNQSPNVHHGGKQKRIGPARGVAADKIAGSPRKDRSYPVNSGRKLRCGGHE